MANFPIDSYLQAIAHKRKADAETKGAFGTQLSQGLQTGMAQGFQDVRTNKANALKEISDNNKKLYDNTLTLLQSGKYSIKDSSGTEVDPLEYPKIAKMVSKNEPITGMYKVETIKTEIPAGFVPSKTKVDNIEYVAPVEKNPAYVANYDEKGNIIGYTPVVSATGEALNKNQIMAGAKPSDTLTPEGETLAADYFKRWGTPLVGGFGAKYMIPAVNMMARDGVTPEQLGQNKIATKADTASSVGMAQAKNAVYRDYTSGKMANNITAINTALRHLDTLYEDTQALDNPQIRLLGVTQNWTKKQVSDPVLAKLKGDVIAVGSELANTFKTTGATQEEIQSFIDAIDIAQSKEAVQSAVEGFIDKIAGRTVPVYERWQNAFGDYSSFPVVGRGGLAVLKKHNYIYDKSTGEIKHNSNPQPSPTPQPGEDMNTETRKYKIMKDADGNKAKVYDDGTIEEIQ